MQSETRRLMLVTAHPDDETLGFGGILAKYADEGVQTTLVCTTRGERGWFGKPEENPGLSELGRIREKELYAAARTLGVREVTLLNHLDGDLDQAEHTRVIRQIAEQIRRVRPQVVLTFDPFGAYGHPDHIAVSQFTSAAVVEAASPSSESDYHAHKVSKLYYRAETPKDFAVYERVFGELVMQVDGVERRAMPWPKWAVTTVVDTRGYSQQVWDAVLCHRTQLPGYEALVNLRDDPKVRLWNTYTFYRAFSITNSGRALETDLFDGADAANPLTHDNNQQAKGA